MSVLVYEKIALVFAEIEPIAKSARNVQSGYAARSIDDLYDSLHAIFARHGLRPIPALVEHSYEWLESRSGTRLCHVFAIYDVFIEASDGSRTEQAIRVVSEGRDAADKAANKALSGAMKYALLSSFLIPVTGEDDPDLATVEATSEAIAVPVPVNAAKAEVLRAASGDRGVAAQAWGDALATLGIVDEESIEASQLPGIVAHARDFIEEATKIEKVST